MTDTPEPDPRPPISEAVSKAIDEFQMCVAATTTSTTARHRQKQHDARQALEAAIAAAVAEALKPGESVEKAEAWSWPRQADDPLASIKTAIACHSRDWSLHYRDAWIYGVVCGWGEALPEIAERHGWSAAEVSRLERLHDLFTDIAAQLADRDTRITGLEALLCDSEAENNDLKVRLERAEARVKELEEALRSIAVQEPFGELPDEAEIRADCLETYDTFIYRARSALSGKAHAALKEAVAR
jgi:hypothetical protein